MQAIYKQLYSHFRLHSVNHIAPGFKASAIPLRLSSALLKCHDIDN